MKTLLIILCVFAFVIFFFNSVGFRCFCKNIFNDIKYFFIDFFRSIKFKSFNQYPDDGQIIAFNGLFGSGKTLSMVHYCRLAYAKYNNKIVYDKELGFVRQYIHIVSNVDISDVPVIKLTSLSDIIQITKTCRKHELDNKCRDVFICAVDEAAVQMSSRNFKSNFNMEFINSLMTCRHYHISFLYTSVRFNNVDAMLRQVTSFAYDVHRPLKWRIMVQYVYDAWDMENTTDKTKVKPVKKLAWFIKDSDFDCYDTLSVVESFRKDAENHDLLSDIEILQLRSGNTSDPEAITNKSRFYKNRLRLQSKKN